MIVLALLIGIVAGSRTMLAVAAVAWGAKLNLLPLGGTALAFLGWRFTAWVFTLLALGELVGDQRPSTPSRKVPVQLVGRLLTGALSGAAIGLALSWLAAGLVLGVIGALIGTYGGAALRARLAASFGRDRPAALAEDGLALLLALFVLGAL